MKKKPMLCREMIGREVRLLRAVSTLGGAYFHKGRRMKVTGHYLGKFELRVLHPNRVKVIKHRGGGETRHTGIVQIPRWYLEVLPR